MGASDAGFASFRPSLQHPSTAFGNATLARHEASDSVASASKLPGHFVNRRGKHETGPQGGPQVLSVSGLPPALPIGQR